MNAPTSTQQSSLPGPRDRLHVMVVDDDDILAEYIALELEQLGCQTTCAFDGVSALAQIDERVNMLLTDWQMPGMDGLELARAVRAGRGPDQPIHIAMMTAGQGREAIRGALAAGVDDFLPKPVDPAQLELAIESARRNVRMHRRLQRRAALLSMAHARTREALQKVREDLEAAAGLHRRLLPEPDADTCARIAHIYVPATTIGGDTLGASDLGDDKLMFFLVDVQGHGVPAALDSFHLHHRLMGLRPATPEALVAAATAVNSEILAQVEGSYATLVCGLIDCRAERGWLVRCGHPPAMLLRDGKLEVMERGGGMPVGWFADAAFPTESFAFPPGARLAIYSDGLTDAEDGAGRPFGTEGLEQALLETRDRPIATLIDLIGERLALGQPSQTLVDDISLLVIEAKTKEH